MSTDLIRTAAQALLDDLAAGCLRPEAAAQRLRAALAAEQRPTCTDGRACAYERNGLDACDRACALRESDPDDVVAFMAEDAAPGGTA